MPDPTVLAVLSFLTAQLAAIYAIIQQAIKTRREVRSNRALGKQERDELRRLMILLLHEANVELPPDLPDKWQNGH